MRNENNNGEDSSARSLYIFSTFQPGSGVSRQVFVQIFLHRLFQQRSHLHTFQHTKRHGQIVSSHLNIPTIETHKCISALTISNLGKFHSLHKMIMLRNVLKKHLKVLVNRKLLRNQLSDFLERVSRLVCQQIRLNQKNSIISNILVQVKEQCK